MKTAFYLRQGSNLDFSRAPLCMSCNVCIRSAAICPFDYLLLFCLVTGASFVVFSGALKPSSPFMAKVNIVEGLLPVFAFQAMYLSEYSFCVLSMSVTCYYRDCYIVSRVLQSLTSEDCNCLSLEVAMKLNKINTIFPHILLQLQTFSTYLNLVLTQQECSHCIASPPGGDASAGGTPIHTLYTIWCVR